MPYGFKNVIAIPRLSREKQSRRELTEGLVLMGLLRPVATVLAMTIIFYYSIMEIMM
jgi:hypothetical protein